MVALASVIVIVLLSLLVTRIATVALTLTGMSREAARFQARSALTGVGFTTSEAESVVNHPVRRRIILLLMLAGSAGIVTAIATLMLSFVGAGSVQTLSRLGVLIAALAAVVVASRSRVVDRGLSRVIGRLLRRWTDIEARDYAELLHIGGDYAVMEQFVEQDSWVADQSFRELDLRGEGVAVLGIERSDGTYLGAPTLDEVPHVEDTLVLYGTSDELAELCARRRGPEGDRAHAEAVERRGAERSGDATAA